MAGANEYLLSLLALYGASSTNLAAAEENPTGAGRGAVHCKGSRCSLLPSWQAQGQQQHVAGRVSRPALRQAQRLGLAATLRLHGGSQSLLDSLKVPLAFAGWYLMSIVYSVLNKEVLTVWKFPCVFSAVQLLVGALWIGGLWTPLPTFGMRKQRYAPLREPPQLSWSQLWAVSSVAIWLALGHVMSTVAPAYGTVAFTNVVKTLEPLFTCLFSAVLLRQVFALPVYLSLVPVILGVALASASEVSFSMISLVSGLLSNVCFALRAISAKKLMSRPVGENMHAQNLYGVLTMIALAAILPIALAIEGRTIVAGTQATIDTIGWPRFLRMLLLCGISHYTYNECAFLALSSVHPVTHAVANTIKRVAVIVVTVLWFRNPLTLTGALGSAIAIAGVLLYSLAKAQPPPASLPPPPPPPPSQPTLQAAATPGLQVAETGRAPRRNKKQKAV